MEKLRSVSETKHVIQFDMQRPGKRVKTLAGVDSEYIQVMVGNFLLLYRNYDTAGEPGYLQKGERESEKR